MKKRVLLIAAMLAPAAFCQLTVDQKVTDFMQLAGILAKNYSFHEWKRDFIGFDFYDVKPWVEKVKASQDDLEFYDICTRYIASLQDSHDEYFLISDFIAALPISFDVYDGKVLIDSIARRILPEADFPFKIGDELVSLDGKSTEELIEAYLPYSVNGSGSVTARRRLAANTIWLRQQQFVPRAPEVGDNATIVVRNAAGALGTYVLPWAKSGTPLWHTSPVISPRPAMARPQTQAARLPNLGRGASLNAELFAKTQSSGTGAADDTAPPAAVPNSNYPPEFQDLHRSGRFDPLGFAMIGQLAPLFKLPADFNVRLGAVTDNFVSATFPVDGRTVGYIRLPTMEPANQKFAYRQFEDEIEYFNRNTDALVVDLMGNGGGDVCYTENIGRYLFDRPFRGVFSRLRANQPAVLNYSKMLSWARQNASQAVIDMYSGYLAEIQSSLNRGGMTRPLPICEAEAGALPPFYHADGSMLSYNKPILVLVDDQTLSSAELLAMFMQDERRGTIFGVRTGGGGGNPTMYWDAGVYSEGNARITTSMFTRKTPVSTPGYPTVDHIENVGIYPDIIANLLTRENLVTGGAPFVASFREAVANLIRGQ